jgi:polar amino acid transport system permease protein
VIDQTMDLIASFFRDLHQRRGINLTIFYDPFDVDRFFHGLVLTIELFLVAAVVSVVIGLVGAGCLTLPHRAPKALTRGYVAFFRNTPPLIQLYFFYFGLGALVPAGKNAYGFPTELVDNFDWALIALSLYAGAFNVEIFRSGIEAIHKSIVEAAVVLGYSRIAAFIYVLVPLAWRISLPALCNNLVELLKTTTLAYAIGVPELLYMSNQIWSDNINTFEMMNVLMVVYLLLVGLLALVMNRWERALRLPGFGAAAR